MKNLILIAIVLGAPTAFACPALTGNYVCSTSEGPGQVAIEEADENGVKVYLIGGDKVYTDGVARPFADSEMTGTISATCGGLTLTMIIKADLLENGQKVGKLDASAVVTKTETGLVQDTTGTLKYHFQEYPIQDSVTCTKN
jgi:hypothetical protein